MPTSGPPPDSIPNASVLATPMTLGAAISGAAIGALIGMLAGPVGAVLLAVIGALIGVAIRLLSARSPQERAGGIDPFTVQEPWRRLTQDAQRTRTTFRDALSRTPAGPIHDRLDTIGSRVDDAVANVWRTAQAGHELAAALYKMLAESDSAARVRDQVEVTEQRLRRANDELTETLALAIELSVSANAPDEFNSIEAGVSAISDELGAVYSALQETSSLSRRPGPSSTDPPSEPGTGTGSAP